MNLIELKQKQKAALDKAEALLGPPDHVMTKAENEQYNAAMADYHSLDATVKARESLATIRTAFPNGMPGIGTPNGVFNAPANADFSPLRLATARNPEYAQSLVAFLRTGGKAHSEALVTGSDGNGGYIVPGSEQYTRQRNANGSFAKMSAAMYEGSEGSSDAAGGYAISVPTIEQIVPLALPDLGVFDASMVIPTATDIKIPQQASFGASALKSESTGTIATFGGTDPTLGQVTLSAFTAGALRLASWELLQDVQAFQQFVVDDLLKGQRILEGSLLATGSGTNEALGVFGNTGTGTGSAYALTGASTDGQLLLDSLFDVTATLKGVYQAGAVWIMSRATGLAIRRAQMQSNLFVPVATVDPDGTERILGKPVFFDVNAPTLPTATTAGVVPILYGDFKAGYLIGIRGGAGINVKVLDQPWAAQGQLGILAYRRLDGRVRRSEAIQQIEFSHS
ncbi:MAG: phage major capsid protein [Terracidiphilus sp.]